MVNQVRTFEFLTGHEKLSTASETDRRSFEPSHHLPWQRRPWAKPTTTIHHFHNNNNSNKWTLPRRRHTINISDHNLLRLSIAPKVFPTHPNSKRLVQPNYVLVTGGAGYIGSHTVLELLHAGYEIVVMDNLINSNLEALRRVEYLAGRQVHFIQGDVTQIADLEYVFSKYEFWAVIHFAALKAVAESTRIPLDYYHNNLTGSMFLLRVMEKFGVKNLVFSSSATVYGEPEKMPVDESAQLGPVTNPYGRTKLFVEELLRDVCASDPEWNVCLLRYFNPVGAHPSGLIGEHSEGVPNNLMPYVIRVLQGQLPYVNVYGNDYDTVDGTGVRDYIHVCDLATGHVSALKKLAAKPGCVAYNLGTGAGHSVMQIMQAMEKASQKKIPYKLVDRRPGDVGICIADASLANHELGWFPVRTMDDMCRDMWRWSCMNRKGYSSS
ncbi:hypothetical protein EC973_008380 [Apophysomyces ossiformis]|uniref:NAD(P)-binding domain-containing protein n=1 Tax=Apophysomyces ossiformis TaxID=679940 RepID=A0A8H7EQD8_9FUNG|nr:hypothetical protein EC973_008380 [Apophysomyces ossiformis]